MQQRFYEGVVEDRNDPLQLGRVRVRVFTLHTENKELIKTEDLPWASVLQPSNSAGTSGIGQSPTGPVEGSWVVLYFRVPEEYREPVVVGIVPGIESVTKLPKNIGYTDPNGRYPEEEYLNLSPISLLARFTPIASKLLRSREDNTADYQQLPIANSDLKFSEPQIPKTTGYPYGKVFQSESGHVLEFDDSPGGERVCLTHGPSGSYLEMDHNGTVTSKIVGDGYEICQNNKNVYVRGDMNVTVAENANIFVGGNTELQVGGNVHGVVAGSVSAEIGGDMSVTVAKNINIKSGKKIEISAKDKIVLASKNIEIKAKEGVRVEGSKTVNILSEKSTMEGSQLSVVKSGNVAALTGKSAATVLSEGVSFVNAPTVVIGVAQAGPISPIFSGKKVSLKSFLAADKLEELNVLDKALNSLKTQMEAVQKQLTAMKEKLAAQFAASKLGTFVKSVTTFAAKAKYWVGKGKAEAAKVQENISKYVPSYNDALAKRGGGTVEDAGMALIGNSRGDQFGMIHDDTSLVDEKEPGFLAHLQLSISQGYLKGMPQDEKFDPGSLNLPKEEEIFSPEVAPTPVEEQEVSCSAIYSLGEIPDTLPLSRHFTLGDVSNRAAVTHDFVRPVIVRVNGKTVSLSKQAVVCNLKHLCTNALDPIKDQFPDMIITSGFRHVDGGSSQHNRGEAADIQFKPDITLDEYYLRCLWISKTINFDQLLLEYKNFGTGKPWIHVSYAINQKRRSKLTMYNHMKVANELVPFHKSKPNDRFRILA